MRFRYPVLTVVFSLLLSVQTPARAYDALEACRAQSLLTSAIHDCLDNYLALIDQNLDDLTVYIDSQMQGLERGAFSRAQNSFYSYRRENCLWYLEIGGPRVQAEQVAKNCLAKMSQDRLSELQGLIADYENDEVEKALGTGDDETIDNLPAANPPDEPVEEPAISADASSVETDEEDGVSAYLGAWQVTCTTTGARRCTTDVPLIAQGEEATGAIMRIRYRANNRASAELHFPNDDLDAPEKLSWRVDNYTFGAIPGSLISVDDEAAKQIINEVKFVRDELIPLFESGGTVGVTLLDEVNGVSGKEFEATLVGFSRARSFANDFISGELP